MKAKLIKRLKELLAMGYQTMTINEVLRLISMFSRKDK